MTEHLRHDGRGFLTEPAITSDVERIYDADLADDGYVNNLTRMWAHQPAIHDLFWGLMNGIAQHGELDLRTRGVLVCATARALRDRYCALAWGRKLAANAGEEVAVAVLEGRGDDLSDRERALARWAGRVVSNAWATTPADVEDLRAAGLADAEITAATVYIAGRIAFSTVNAALGAHPDPELTAGAPTRVRLAVERWPEPGIRTEARVITPRH